MRSICTKSKNENQWSEVPYKFRHGIISLLSVNPDLYIIFGPSRSSKSSESSSVPKNIVIDCYSFLFLRKPESSKLQPSYDSNRKEVRLARDRDIRALVRRGI